MKRILNIIGIFFLSIIVFTSCQKSPEELNEGSPQTRAAGVTEPIIGITERKFT